MFLLARIENVDEQACTILHDADVAMEARVGQRIHTCLHHELPEGVVHHRGLCPLTSAFCCQNAMLARTAALCAASCNTCRRKKSAGFAALRGTPIPQQIIVVFSPHRRSVNDLVSSQQFLQHRRCFPSRRIVVQTQHNAGNMGAAFKYRKSAGGSCRSFFPTPPSDSVFALRQSCPCCFSSVR